MGDFLFNIARGRGGEFYYRVDNNDPANSALVIVVLASAGIETDAVLKDQDDLATILAASPEATNTNYARKTLTDSSLSAYTPDDTNDWLYLDCADQTWSSVGVGDVWAKLLVCYDSDTTGGTDSSIVPWLAFDFAWTPDGTDITWIVPALGFYRSG